MKKIMLVGECRAGKASLIRALSKGEYAPRRAMAVEYFGRFINTPGEFLENRRFYPALITASMDCDILLLLQDAARDACLFPPQFATMFNRQVVGVVTKADAENASPRHLERAERFLRNAGARTILRVSARSGEGLTALRALLES